MAPQVNRLGAGCSTILIMLLVILLHTSSTNAMLHGSSDAPFSSFSQQYGEAMASGASSVSPEALVNWLLNEDPAIYSVDSGPSDYTLFQSEQAPVFQHSLFDADEHDNTIGQDLSDSFINDDGNATDALYSQPEMSTTPQHPWSPRPKESLMSMLPQGPLSSRPSSSRLSVVTSTPNTSFFTSPSVQQSPYESSIASAPAMSRQVSGQRNEVDNMFSSFDDIPYGNDGDDETFQPAELITRLTFTAKTNENTTFENLSNSPDILRDITAYNELPRQQQYSVPPSPKPSHAPSKRQGKQTYRYNCEECDQVFIRPKDTVAHFGSVHNRTLPANRNHPCTRCKQSFQYPKDLKKHLTVHSGEKPYSCVCGLPYTRKDNLQRHQHGENGRGCGVFLQHQQLKITA